MTDRHTMGWKTSLLEGRSLKTAAVVVKKPGTDPSGPFQNPRASLLPPGFHVCLQTGPILGPGGGGRRDGDSGVEPSKRHHSSAGCHEAGPTRLRHVTHLLAPSAPQFHSEPLGQERPALDGILNPT